MITDNMKQFILAGLGLIILAIILFHAAANTIEICKEGLILL